MLETRQPGLPEDTRAAKFVLLKPETHTRPPRPFPRSVPGAHEGGCYGLAFSRTGGLLASGGADKCVRLWEPSTATLTSTLHVSRLLIEAIKQAGRQAG